MRTVMRMTGLSAMVLGMCLVLAGCEAEPTPQPQTKSLYDRLGGEPAITKVVDDFVAIAAPDPAVNFFRKGTPAEWKPSDADVAKLKKHLVQLIAMNAGGPQKYEGKDMKKTHAGMGISEAEFGAIAADLGKALDKNGVPAKEKGEVIAIAASTHDAIVEKK